jgi:hypothetical protein
MKLSRFTLNLLLLALTVACTVNIRTMERFKPRYKGVDPIIAPLVNEYLDLAKDRGLKFRHKVTVGFMNIKDSNVIGMCHYDAFFREIDIDRNYWNHASKISRAILLKHELTHCYCNRNHDYKGIPYSSTDEDFALHKDFGMTGHITHNTEGYYADRCAKSIMFPKILTDDCTKAHYADYEAEMFDGCEAW